MPEIPLCTSPIQSRCIPPSTIQIDIHQGQALKNAGWPQGRKALQDLFASPAYRNLDNRDKVDVLGFFKEHRAEPGRVKAVDRLLRSGALTRVDPYYRQFIYRNLGAARGAHAAKMAKAYEQILTDPPFSRTTMLEKTALLNSPFKAAKVTMKGLVSDSNKHLPSSEVALKAGLKKWLKGMAGIWADQADVTGEARRKAVAKKYAASKRLLGDLRKQWLDIMNRWYEKADYPRNGDTVGQRVSAYLKTYSWQHALFLINKEFGRATSNRRDRGIPYNYPY